MKLRDIAVMTAAKGEAPSSGYAGVLGCRVALGIPTLPSFLVIFYLMVSRPPLSGY